MYQTYYMKQRQQAKAASQRRLFIIASLVLFWTAAYLSYKAEPTCASLHGQTWDYTINQPIACR